MFEEYKTMTPEEFRAAGYHRGYDIAHWQDLFDIGQSIPRLHDWIGIDSVENIDDALEAFASQCSEVESMNRCYSPFEYIASAINSRDDAEDCWTAYDEGIHEGIEANFEARKGYYDDDE